MKQRQADKQSYLNQWRRSQNYDKNIQKQSRGLFFSMVLGLNPPACLCGFSPVAPASSHISKTCNCVWIVVYFCTRAPQWVYLSPTSRWDMGPVFLYFLSCMNLTLFHQCVSVSVASDGPGWGNALEIAVLFSLLNFFFFLLAVVRTGTSGST